MATAPIQVAQPLPTRAQFAEWVKAQIAANPQFVPPDTLTQEDMNEWYVEKRELERIRAKEMLLRLKIFKHYFPSPVEGMNSVALPDGSGIVKGQFKITREIDPAQLAAFKQITVGDMADQLIKLKVEFHPDDVKKPLFDFLKISTDKLVKYDPSLAIKEYRTLTAEQRAFFEQCLVVKAGSPALEIAPPTVKSAAATAT